jgi:hypothetical protein
MPRPSAIFADRDQLQGVMLERTLAGVSTRQCRRAQEPVGEQLKERCPLDLQVGGIADVRAAHPVFAVEADEPAGFGPASTLRIQWMRSRHPIQSDGACVGGPAMRGRVDRGWQRLTQPDQESHYPSASSQTSSEPLYTSLRFAIAGYALWQIVSDTLRRSS